MERKNELESTRIFSDPSSGLLLTHSKLAENFVLSICRARLLLLDQSEGIFDGWRQQSSFGGDETEAVKKMKLVYAKILAREHPNSVKNHMCK